MKLLRDASSTPFAAGIHARMYEPEPFERMLLELFTGFIQSPATQLDKAIEDGLRRIVIFLGVDRSTLSEFARESQHFRVTHSWALPGLNAVPASVNSHTYPWVLATVRAGKPVIFSRPQDLPAEATQDARSYMAIGLRSHVALPLFVGGELVGLLGFGTLRAEREWPEHFLNRLRLVAEVFANALARKRAQGEIDQGAGFEARATQMLASLVLSSPGDEDDAIDGALRDIGQFLGLDRVALWTRTPPHTDFVKTHRWVPGNDATTSNRLGGNEIPWISARLLERTEVCMVGLAELPGEAHIDVAALRRLDIRSMLIVPLCVAGEVVGAFSLVSTRAERDWAPSVVRGARLLAQVFASVLARRAVELQAEQDRMSLHHVTRVSMVGQLSASIAHQLNQPLAAILGNAEAAQQMLRHDAVDMTELRAICDDIVTENHRAADVIRRLGALFKRGEMKLQPVDLNVLVRDTLDLLRSELLLRHVQVEIALAEGLPTVAGSTVQLQQVLLNLVLNAAEAMAELPPDQRQVRIRTDCTGAGVHLHVSDIGIGIPVPNLRNIFDAFWTNKPGGMGIGLAICKSIASAHRGTITAHNHAGAGATFCVALPLLHPA